MKISNLKEKITVARKAVEDEEEPFRTAAFTVILGKLLDQSTVVNQSRHDDPQKHHTSNPPEQPKPVATDVSMESGKQELAKSCGISVKELNEVISFNKGTVQIIAPISGKETDKQIAATQCILLTHEIVLGVEWVPSSLLRKCIDLSGIGELDHLARNIRRNSSIIRARGKKPNLEYKLVGPGRPSAIECIKKLVHGGVSK